MNDKEILTKLGLGSAEAAIQDRALQNFYNIVDKRTMGIVSELMTAEQRSQFEANSSTMSGKELAKWLADNVTDADEVYKNVTLDYLDEVANS